MNTIENVMNLCAKKNCTLWVNEKHANLHSCITLVYIEFDFQNPFTSCVTQLGLWRVTSFILLNKFSEIGVVSAQVGTVSTVALAVRSWSLQQTWPRRTLTVVFCPRWAPHPASQIAPSPSNREASSVVHVAPRSTVRPTVDDLVWRWTRTAVVR